MRKFESSPKIASIFRGTDQFLTRHFTGRTLDYRQILAILFPLFIDQAFLVCMNFLNTTMISSSGVAAVSAVNMVDSLNIFLVNVFIAVATGGTIVVAQYKGRGDEGMITKAVYSSVTGVFLVASMISLLIMLLHSPLLLLLFGEADKEVLVNARIYLLGSCTSYGGIAIMEAVCGALRGIGAARSSLMLTVTMNLSYVLFNLLFIHGMGMGVLGMVISLNIARYGSAVFALLYLSFRNRSLGFRLRDLFHVDFAMLRRTFRIGMPFAAEQMFFNGGKILTQTFIVGMGTYAIATNAISSSLTSLFQIPGATLSLTIVTVVGQCVGNRDIDQAKKVIRSFVVTCSIAFAVMALILLPLYRPLVSLFAPPEQIVSDIFIVVLVNALAQIPLWAPSFMVPAGLRAGGDSKYTSIMSMLSMWLFRVVLGYLLGVHFRLGILGVWVAMDCEWGIRGLIFLARFRGKKWYQHRVIDE